MGYKKNLEPRHGPFVYPYLKELTADKYDLSYHGHQRSAPLVMVKFTETRTKYDSRTKYKH
nr:hypothetical protein [Staphylococcus sp. KG4-3]MDW8561507.1 hypothetical protein [Staphylococcus sp. KG4-3]